MCNKHSLEARVGIGQFTPLLRPKYTRIHWLLNINRLNPTIPILTPLVSVLVSALPMSLSINRDHYGHRRQPRQPEPADARADTGSTHGIHIFFNFALVRFRYFERFAPDTGRIRQCMLC
jgi:hypothetical protein